PCPQAAVRAVYLAAHLPPGRGGQQGPGGRGDMKLWQSSGRPSKMEREVQDTPVRVGARVSSFISLQMCVLVVQRGDDPMPKTIATKRKKKRLDKNTKYMTVAVVLGGALLVVAIVLPLVIFFSTRRSGEQKPPADDRDGPP